MVKKMAILMYALLLGAFAAQVSTTGYGDFKFYETMKPHTANWKNNIKKPGWIRQK
jgi:hypothetical protein